MTRLRALPLVLSALCLLGVFVAPAFAAGKPNVKVGGLTLLGASVPGGSVLSAKVAVANNGEGDAGKSVTALLLSKDNKKSSDDIVLAPVSKLGKLKSGKRKTLTVGATVPLTTPAGNYFVAACADFKRKVSETRESDNCRFSKATVTITSTGGTPTIPTPEKPAPTGPTGPGDMDADNDGIPDTSDCRPSDPRLPGAGHPTATNCAATIYEAADGTGGDGAVVALDNVLVSAVGSAGHIYVQIKPGDAGYANSNGARFSGLEVSNAFGRTRGERVNIYGTLNATATGYVLASQTPIAVVGSGESTFAAPITFTTFLVDSAAYDGVLISLPSISIGSIDVTGWHLDLGGTPMTVANTLIGTLPNASATQGLSTLIGIGESASAPLTLMPRDNGDLLLDPLSCATASASAC